MVTRSTPRTSRRSGSRPASRLQLRPLREVARQARRCATRCGDRRGRHSLRSPPDQSARIRHLRLPLRRADREESMATKIIVSYDGTDNDLDALALGRVLGGAGASLALAYVRHSHEVESGRERLAEGEAKALPERSSAALGQPDVPRHVVLSGSTPEGLRGLALAEHADLIVFGSEYRTAAGHVDPQASARRLLDGGPV